MHGSQPPLIPADMLLLAYRKGIFPMADGRQDREVFWVEPRERAVIPMDGFQCSRSLAKTIRQGRFTVTCNKDFAGVVSACAQPRKDHPESWISARIAASYDALHVQGNAHSIECWQSKNEDNADDARGTKELVGGVYGVAFDKVFCGESMFSRQRDASKVALAWLHALLRRAGCEVFDCQFMTDHLASLGAQEMAQAEYVQSLEAARGEQRQTLPEAYDSLVEDASAAGADSPGKLIAQSLTQTS
ncbi:leucyl/phenylalanyl-tRNA--protein transferase [Altererythrobacter sp.]|nr:leucyl/phenylalanyl-tRNA--protein transferase [Altererythrobacter sp.]